MTLSSRRFVPFARLSTVAVALATVVVVTPGLPASAGTPPCDITGTDGDDRLVGTSAPEVICGLGGDDVILPGGGDDHVRGGTGVDTVDYGPSPVGIVLDLKAGTASGTSTDALRGVEDARGSAHADVMRGNARPNVLRGRRGPDELRGRGGDDVLGGDGWRDLLLGGDGSDVLVGGPEDDALRGGRDGDKCLPGAGSDQSSSCFGDLVRDRNDATGPLDVRLVEIRRGRAPAFRIRTASGWTIRGTWDRAFFLVFFDTLDGGGSDYHALIRSDGRRLRGTLFRETAGGGERAIRSLHVRHPGPRVALVRVPLSAMRFAARRLIYRWTVQTIYNRGPCPNACFDFAPNVETVPELRP